MKSPRRSLVIASIALGAVGTLLACESFKGMNAPAPSIGGAAPLTSHFEPFSSTSAGSKLTPQAVQVYKGDAAALKITQPTIVGTIEVQFNTPSPIETAPSFDVMVARAGRDAADKGATHVFVLEDGFDVRTFLAEGPAASTDAGLGGAGTSRSGNTRIKLAAFRADPDKWGVLPEAMRPRPLDAKDAPKAEAPKPASSSAPSAAPSGSAVRGRPPASI